MNWFDIIERDGYFSLNDEIGDLLRVSEERELITGLLKRLKDSDFELNEDLMKMIGGFTIIRLCNMLGNRSINVNKEYLLSLNVELNKIKKV